MIKLISVEIKDFMIKRFSNGVHEFDNLCRTLGFNQKFGDEPAERVTRLIWHLEGNELNPVEMLYDSLIKLKPKLKSEIDFLFCVDKQKTVKVKNYRAYNSAIFISYNSSNDEIAMEINNSLILVGFKTIIDKKDLSYGQSVKSFMERISTCDFVVMIISDSFLKSDSCMYEVNELVSSDISFKKCVPIVLDDTNIYGSKEINYYIYYWQKEYEDLRIQFNSFIYKSMGTGVAEQNIKRTERIVNNVGFFLKRLQDIKHLKHGEIIESNYNTLLEFMGSLKEGNKVRIGDIDD